MLDAPSRAEFVVRGPDGRPVAGARIQPRALDREFFAVPDGLAERIEAQTVTDDHGRAVLAEFFPDEISTIFVSAPGLGRQQFGFGLRGGSQEARTIDLMPVGRVEGRIVADDPEIARNHRLTVMIWDRRLGPPALGLFYLRTDPQGRFVIPEVPVGGLSVSGMPTAGSPWFLESPPDLKVEAGKTTRVDVRPIKGFRLKGVVRERGTGSPIAGVGLGPYGRQGDDDATVSTNAEGRFTLFALRSALLLPGAVPEGYAAPHFSLEDPKVPEGAAEFELPPIELSRAGTVRGFVVDERGEPVPGATVMASWPVNEGPGRSSNRDTRAVTGRHGEFLVDRVVAEAPCRPVGGCAPDGAPDDARGRIPSRGAEPARLVLDSSGSVSLSGRVVDAMGHRVAGARAHIRVQHRYPGGQVRGNDMVEIRGAYVIKTNDTGWFRTPPILDPDLEYAALAEADGFEPARTGWVAGTAGTFPELVLRPEARDRPAAVDGSVADRAGRPVSGAAVWTTNDAGTPIRSSTDARGRFRLEKIPPRRSFLFVEAAGFRFSGRVVDPAAGPVSITLTRSDERPAATMSTLPPARPRAEERALANRLIRPYAERAVKEGDESTRLRSLEILALSDPARVLEIVETGIMGNPWYNDYLRRDCARALREDSHAGGTRRWSRRCRPPSGGARGHLDACDAMPPADRKARVEQVDQGVFSSAGDRKSGDHRVQALGQVAEHYLDLGEVEKGKKLLRLTRSAAVALPKEGWGGYARGSFAEELAQVDAAAAIELIEGVGENPIPDRHRINMVKELAGRDPARAEALLATLKQPDILARNLPGLCYAMARKDPERARRIADRDLGKGPNAQALPFARSYALGMIALALADSDKPRASRFLGEAFAALNPLAAEGRRGSGGLEIQDAAIVAAAMVPVAERIDPALVSEFFWRAASFRSTSRPRMDQAGLPDAALALLLARYDRDAAMVLLAPVLDRGPDRQGRRTLAAGLARALAAVAPERAVALVEAMPDDPGLNINPFEHFKNEARLDLAAFLARPPGERWNKITDRLLHLWVVGNEDAFENHDRCRFEGTSMMIADRFDAPIPSADHIPGRHRR